MKISVVILTKNSEKHIRECIRSVLTQNYPDFEVLIIDAGSKDKTKSIILEEYNKIINCISPTFFSLYSNTSVGKARQIGVDNSEGEIIAFVDSDVELPHENWLKNMCKPLISCDNVAGVQTLAKCHPSDPTILKKIHSRFEYTSEIISLLNYQPIGTSHILLKKDVLLNAGGFPDVFHGEDIVVMKNIMKMGYCFVYLKEEKCYHYHVDSWYSHIKRQFRGIKNQIKTLLFK